MEGAPSANRFGGRLSERGVAFEAGDGMVQVTTEASPISVSRRVASLGKFDWALILALAVVVRAVALGGNSLWSDEAFSVLWARQGVGYLVGAGARLEPNPPLYYVLLHAWMRLFGDSAEAVRSLSVVFSTLTALTTYAIGRALLGRRAAFVAGLFAALAPASVFFAQEARAYALLACLEGAALLALACYARGVAIGRMRRQVWLIAFAAAAVGAAFTHYTAVVFVAAGFAMMTLHVAFPPDGAGREFRALLVAGLTVAPGLACALALGGSQAASPALNWIPPLSLRQIETFLRSTATYPGMPLDRAALFACAALALALVASPAWRRLDRAQFGLLILLPALYVALAIGVSLARPILLPRIGVWLTIPLCLALAGAVVGQGAARRRALAGVVCAAAFAVALASYFVDYRKEDWRAAAHLAAADPRCDGPVLFSGVFLPLLYYQPSIASRPFYASSANWDEAGPLQLRLTRDVARPQALDPAAVNSLLETRRHAFVVVRRGSEAMLDAAPPPAVRVDLPGGLTVACF